MNDNNKIFNNQDQREISNQPRFVNEPSNPSAVARQRQQPTSRRAKLMDIYNTTKTSYIPTITNSITSFVGTEDKQTLPPNAKIDLYETYSIKHADDRYVVNVYGHIFCPGTMSRKNRLLLTLARQLVKTPSNAVADQFQGELNGTLENPDKYDGDDESIASMDSGGSTSTASINTESTLKERLEGFMTRSLPGTPLKVVIGSEADIEVEKLIQPEVVSDDNGNFKLELETNYRPSVVQVTCLANDEIVCFRALDIIENKESISIISDIDDTVKLTGVVNDKRDMFRNVFVRDYKDIEIPGFVNWFMALKAKECRIHYVSNSPWQLLRPIMNFFQYVGLPSDSIHLKQYSGNVISALMEPASERKKSTLIKIVSDFSNRKFILLGDTGEKDLEAYLTLAKLFPDQILRIYMRVVPNSLSDINDQYVYDNIMTLLNKRNEFKENNEMKDLIDLGSFSPPKSRTIKKKFAPIIPKKPNALKGQVVKPFKGTSNEQANMPEEKSPTLPQRRVQTFANNSELKSHGYSPPHRAATDPSGVVSALSPEAVQTSDNVLDSAHVAPNSLFNISNVMPTLNEEDKRGTLWRERMIRLMNELPDSVDIKFFHNVDEIIEDSLSLVNNYADKK